MSHDAGLNHLAVHYLVVTFDGATNAITQGLFGTQSFFDDVPAIVTSYDEFAYETDWNFAGTATRRRNISYGVNSRR